MKPFNLEEAKAGKPVCTRDGRSARIICFDAKFRGYPILALVEQEDGTENVNSFCLDGRYNITMEKGWEDDSFLDLFMKTERHEGWVNIYKTGNVTYSGYTIYLTKEEAENGEEKECVDTIKIEWEAAE